MFRQQYVCYHHHLLKSFLRKGLENYPKIVEKAYILRNMCVNWQPSDPYFSFIYQKNI
jgi:hypothetical protein